MYPSKKLLILDLNIFIIVATVPSGLQTCVKVWQKHFSGSGGTPWMQPKSIVTFKKDLIQAIQFSVANFGFKCFHYSGLCAHRVANGCKSAANLDYRGRGDTLVATQK